MNKKQMNKFQWHLIMGYRDGPHKNCRRNLMLVKYYNRTRRNEINISTTVMPTRHVVCTRALGSQSKEHFSLLTVSTFCMEECGFRFTLLNAFIQRREIASDILTNENVSRNRQKKKKASTANKPVKSVQTNGTCENNVQ